MIVIKSIWEYYYTNLAPCGALNNSKNKIVVYSKSTMMGFVEYLNVKMGRTDTTGEFYINEYPQQLEQHILLANLAINKV